MRWPFITKRQAELLGSKAIEEAKREQLLWLRDILTNADKIYLEPVTGHVGSVTNSVFLVTGEGTALTCLPPDPISEDEMADTLALLERYGFTRVDAERIMKKEKAEPADPTCLCAFRYLGLSNPPTLVWGTSPDCPLHKDLGPVWYGTHGTPITHG